MGLGLHQGVEGFGQLGAVREVFPEGAAERGRVRGVVAADLFDEFHEGEVGSAHRAVEVQPGVGATGQVAEQGVGGLVGAEDVGLRFGEHAVVHQEPQHPPQRIGHGPAAVRDLGERDGAVLHHVGHSQGGRGPNRERGGQVGHRPDVR